MHISDAWWTSLLSRSASAVWDGWILTTSACRQTEVLCIDSPLRRSVIYDKFFFGTGDLCEFLEKRSFTSIERTPGESACLTIRSWRHWLETSFSLDKASKTFPALSSVRVSLNYGYGAGIQRFIISFCNSLEKIDDISYQFWDWLAKTLFFIRVVEIVAMKL